MNVSSHSDLNTSTVFTQENVLHALKTAFGVTRTLLIAKVAINIMEKSSLEQLKLEDVYLVKKIAQLVIVTALSAQIVQCISDKSSKMVISLENASHAWNTAKCAMIMHLVAILATLVMEKK